MSLQLFSEEKMFCFWNQIFRFRHASERASERSSAFSRSSATQCILQLFASCGPLDCQGNEWKNYSSRLHDSYWLWALPSVWWWRAFCHFAMVHMQMWICVCVCLCKCVYFLFILCSVHLCIYLLFLFRCFSFAFVYFSGRACLLVYLHHFNSVIRIYF